MDDDNYDYERLNVNGIQYANVRLWKQPTLQSWY